MTDLMDIGEILGVSTLFQSAATALSRLADGQPLSQSEQDTLHEVGHILTAVDYRSSTDFVAGTFSVEATTVRPMFYAAIMRAQQQFLNVGVSQSETLRQFLRELYALMLAQGNMSSTKVPVEQIRLGAYLLESMSRGLMIMLQSRDIPKENNLFMVEAVA